MHDFVCDGGTGGEEQPGLSLTDLAPATSLNVFVQTFFTQKKVLISSGPTPLARDSISNRFSFCVCHLAGF